MMLAFAYYPGLLSCVSLHSPVLERHSPIKDKRECIEHRTSFVPALLTWSAGMVMRMRTAVNSLQSEVGGGRGAGTSLHSCVYLLYAKTCVPHGDRCNLCG